MAKNSVDTSAPYVVDLISKINSKLNEADNSEIALDGKWNLAHHAEKLVLSMLDSDRQRIELHRRFNECERTQAPFTSFYEKRIKKLSGKADSLDPSFHLLISLVSDMQHYNSNKHIKMRYARHAIYRVGLVFGLALTFFLSVISLFHWV